MVGNVDEKGRKLVRCAFDCLAGAFASIKPGKTMYQDMGKVISKVGCHCVWVFFREGHCICMCVWDGCVCVFVFVRECMH